MALPGIPNAQSFIDNGTSYLSLESTQGKQTLVLINGYPIDCSLSEEHEFESDVTEYPVESGSNVADNIRPKPITVTMECIVSNTPIGELDSNSSIASKRARATGIQPSADAYKRFLDIRNGRQLVTISTSLDTFTNMALQSLSIPRTSGGGDYLHFTAKFLQVTMVQNIRTIKTATPLGTGKTTKTAAPVTSAAAPVPTTYKVYRLNGTWLWFDDDISGWREDAVFDPGTGSGKNGNASSTGWVFYKNKPYGITSFAWNYVRLTDAEYQQQIEAAQYNAVNIYDPFNEVTLQGADRSRDIRVVEGVRR